MKSRALLEYEYCSGRLYSRVIIHYRHSLSRPDLASEFYTKATSATFNGERVHWWPNEWHISTMYMRGLRSKPYWAPGHKLKLASWLEEQYATLKDEFLATLADPRYNSVFTQNDHTLIQSGSWGELKLYDGKVW